MTNIKYSKRFKLRNGERVDFCPECDYHITDTVNNSDSVYCPKCGQQIQLFKPALCPKDCDFLKKHQYLGKFFCLAHKYQADKFFECATNRVFKIIPTIEGDKE
jgi:hypothetical protein